MLNKAISFFPALRVIGAPNLKFGTVPFPDALAIEKIAQENKITYHMHLYKLQKEIYFQFSAKEIYIKGVSLLFFGCNTTVGI